MKPLILIVEDEEKIANLIKDYLDQSGYQTDISLTGEAVVDKVKQKNPAMILLDLMLPVVDGLTLCQKIRSFSKIPIIMITAKVDEIDRLLGLEMGADDYICKPFSPREVVARVKSLFRREHWYHDQLQIVNNQRFSLDESRHTVSINDKSTELTNIEFHLLKTLLSETGRIYSRSQLVDSMYSDHRIVSDRTVDSHIKKLRKKLHELDHDHDYVISVYGVGYRIDLPESL